jgi:peptide/nickel transport system substrate-binding protein
MRRSLKLLSLLLCVSLLAAACGGDSEESEENGGGGSGERTETMVFGTSADPIALDGFLVSDGESLRAIDQMFEGLVSLEPGGTEVVPGLAESWEANEDGTSWTFQLREGVTFHDGEEFNAEAVCYNFDRWYNAKGSFQNPGATYYWQTVFGGFATVDFEGAPEESLYESCEAQDDTTVVLNITKPSSSFLSALALTNFTIASPAALEEYGADEGKVNAEGVFNATGTYATEHPTGTGPFKFESWDRGEQLTMVANEDYWGEVEGNIGTLIFKPVGDPAAQLQALQAGDIQGYDLVSPEDYETIQGDDQFQLLERPAFNVAYLGFNQKVAPFDDIAVRQAIAHSIDRQEIVDGFYAGQGVVAHQFMPPELFGYADDVTQYEYDPEKAQQILEDAGYELPVEIEMAYPTNVTRPYMPDPQANFEAMKEDLEENGLFTVQTESADWEVDYVTKVQAGNYGSYLIGWTGDFGDPDNFIGTFFQQPLAEWGFDNEEIFNILDEAEAETDEDARTELYEEANRMIMDFLPGLPYAHSKPALAFTADVEGYTPSPVTLEQFSSVTVGGGE